MSFDEAVKAGPMRCRGCGKDVWPRVGGYWFLLLIPRGRCRFPGVEELKVVLCSFCGRRVREAMESVGIGIEGCFEKVESGSLGAGGDGSAGEYIDRGVVRG